ncbi:hypothetical protein SAMN05878503_12738 [Cereibacter ovatus]|uniref:Uncharacterized protein n=1 Tax=Cereibacter ovatus TaxID=439529 RepID=A0A285D6E8_9RHOB|nr:hypothetical protein [Cereibacter ovatus]SNX74906.1 hypothetical protein SAMN05878503_12738 [Cereibacter ovatus]
MSTSIPLNILMERLGKQLHRLAEMGADIEDAVGRTISRTAPSPSDLPTLQEIDNLVQSLQGLAGYVERLADQVDTIVRVDTSEPIRAVNQKSLAAVLIGCDTVAVEAGSADFF